LIVNIYKKYLLFSFDKNDKNNPSLFLIYKFIHIRIFSMQNGIRTFLFLIYDSGWIKYNISFKQFNQCFPIFTLFSFRRIIYDSKIFILKLFSIQIDACQTHINAKSTIIVIHKITFIIVCT